MTLSVSCVFFSQSVQVLRLSSRRRPAALGEAPVTTVIMRHEVHVVVWEDLIVESRAMPMMIIINDNYESTCT